MRVPLCQPFPFEMANGNSSSHFPFPFPYEIGKRNLIVYFRFPLSCDIGKQETNFLLLDENV